MKYSALFSLLILPILPTLFSCQSNNFTLSQNETTDKNLLLDHIFIPSKNSVIHIESEKEIFFLDEAMMAVVNDKLLTSYSDKRKARVLLDHIFNEQNLSLQYEGNANVVASEAFHSKTANCISLTIMAYALAKEAGLNITFQQVNVPEYWQRNGDYNFLTGHVNLAISENTLSNSLIVWGERDIQIDFDPYISKQKFSASKIEKNTVLAMFYNNKGADKLIENDYSAAYQYFKAAINQDDTFSPAWGNLGILYRLTENLNESENVYRHALKTSDQNLTILNNLALLMKLQNKMNEAKKIELYVHKIRITNPYYHALLADEALYNGEFNLSVKHYKKALSIKDNEHEFYLGLAKAYYEQGKVSLSKLTLRKAIQYNKAKSTNELYVAKLNFLNQLN